MNFHACVVRTEGCLHYSFSYPGLYAVGQTGNRELHLGIDRNRIFLPVLERLRQVDIDLIGHNLGVVACGSEGDGQCACRNNFDCFLHLI